MPATIPRNIRAETGAKYGITASQAREESETSLELVAFGHSSFVILQVPIKLQAWQVASSDLTN